MNWKHVHLIFKREMLDQLRDRRTLFTITVLPLLLYPLLGMLMMQVAQFHRESPVRVYVLGHENWPASLPLLDDTGQIVLANAMDESRQLLEFTLLDCPDDTKGGIEQYAQKFLNAQQADAVIIIDQRFTDRLGIVHAKEAHADGEEQTHQPPVAQLAALNAQSGITLLTNMARDQSMIAHTRLSRLIDQWWDQWRMQQLVIAGLPPVLSAPIQLQHLDTSVSTVRQAVRWTKILPFVMLVWALTGAFYPAIDLCAGEKERGTLETLLSSPARRREIVWGKLLTVNVFSIASALLNLLSMHLTTGMVVKGLSAGMPGGLSESFGPMPIHTMGWLLLLLIPMSAFFSALALAVAALAKSTKEGQYYLMPLLLVTLPLVGVPMIPSVQMNLGTSLIPVSGAILLVRSLIEGRYAEAVSHLPVVFLITGLCCAFAVRWAIRQFESESVMFQEAGRWDMRSWARHLWRDREATAQPSVALLCGALILVVRFFAQFFVSADTSFITQTLLVQLGIILLPCILMACLLTRKPRWALRIHRTQGSHLVAAMLIGFALHPSYQVLGQAIVEVYPISQDTLQVVKQFEGKIFEHKLWVILGLLAVLPAVCEELAFRGFIFGGLLRRQGVLRAVIVSSLLFGFAHAILQQSITASVMGLLLGLIAWRTGGVLCTIVVHAISNALSLSLAWGSRNCTEIPDFLSWAVESGPQGWTYVPHWQFTSVVLSIALFLILFQRSQKTERVVLAETA
ncbi:MAG: CPBP family intramembrane metalloprotease [Pirellulaceae bacterium]|nr:CPBP family intramembrane metalloprotease [Pirellulaceae bacterium]